MRPRFANQADVAALAQMHVQAWDETYRGHLPDAAIAERGLEYRLALYDRIIREGARISMISHVGFAQFGNQRDDAHAAAYPCELFSFYVLKKHHGTGAAQELLRHALGQTPAPFTASVLQGNGRANRFYEKIGGQVIGTDQYVIAGEGHADIIMGFMPETTLPKLRPVG
ncbi:GNAT family N-acetyltransferase [Yoonia sp. 208BN28-4]|uniref:GNAT family N-acetyltransferase n=1 Tax=Yoonia sp. 208BN28-4 TaxID=3126505 RepID=UPI0030A48A33